MTLARKTGLLVSVRSAAEAQLAIEAGVDLLDLKEPSAGALGAVNESVMPDVVRLAAGRVPVSAALGELLDFEPTATHASMSGLSYVKLGLAGCRGIANWKSVWSAAIASLPAGIAAVAVAYADADRADAPSVTDVLSNGAALGCKAFLLDTYDKEGGDLFVHIGQKDLASLLDDARSAGVLSVIGGSLSPETIPIAAALQPDFVAVRGAVCRGGRRGNLDPQKMRNLSQLVRAASAANQRELLAVRDPE